MYNFCDREVINVILNELHELMKEQFTKDERLIIYCVISMFLPCYMCVIFLLFICAYLLYKHELQQSFKEIKGSKYLLLFTLLSFVTSLIHQNYLGALLTIAILAIFCIIVFFMSHMNKRLFEIIIDLFIFMSILAALYGLIEYIGILNKMDIDQFTIINFSSREDRVNSVFFNANYYAMMIEFFVLMCFYKAFNLRLCVKDIRKILYYSVVIALNLFLLYLTSCRTAWPALAVGIFILLYYNHHYKSVTILSIVIIACLIGIYLFPDIFPRMDTIFSYFLTRTDIWEGAIEMLEDNWLIGQGPLTYFHLAESYGSYVTHHAHSVYIDPFLSHGVLGVACLIPYGYHCAKGCMRIAKKKLDRSYLALVLSFIVCILIHGTMDYTIYFIQTSLTFFIVASSFMMYKKEINYVVEG